MPLCPKCGKEMEDNVAFCSSCGANIKESEKKRADKKGGLDPRTLLLISTVSVGTLGLISLSFGVVLGFIILTAASAVLFFFGIKKLDQQDTNTAQLTALIIVIVVAAIGLVTLLMGQVLGILIIASVVPAFMAWNMLRK